MNTQIQSIRSLIKANEFRSGSASTTEFYHLSGLVNECYRHKAIHLKEIIEPHLTGTALLYYPKLAAQLRQMYSGNYPELTREYKLKIDDAENKKGSPFVRYFCAKLISAFEAFDEEITRTQNTVEQLITQYGNERVTPVINSITKRHDVIDTITISGTNWTVGESNYNNTRNCIETLYLRSLLPIDHTVRRVALEEVILGTPFVGIRLVVSDNWKAKGRVYWYNLDTRELIKKPKQTQ